MADCGCKLVCFHQVHPALPPQRTCRKGYQMSHHRMDVMTPMVTVRDGDDAELLMVALQMYLEVRIQENTAAARLPGSDQYSLSLELIEETRHLCDLIEAIGVTSDGTVEDDTEGVTDDYDPTIDKTEV